MWHRPPRRGLDWSLAGSQDERLRRLELAYAEGRLDLAGLEAEAERVLEGRSLFDSPFRSPRLEGER